jgi:hypothetical protein
VLTRENRECSSVPVRDDPLAVSSCSDMPGTEPSGLPTDLHPLRAGVDFAEDSGSGLNRVVTLGGSVLLVGLIDVGLLAFRRP